MLYDFFTVFNQCYRMLKSISIHLFFWLQEMATQTNKVKTQEKQNKKKLKTKLGKSKLWDWSGLVLGLTLHPQSLVLLLAI